MRHAFFDLFGVLAVPLPAPVLVDRVRSAGISVPPTAEPWVGRGFAVAMALDESERTLSAVRDLHLTTDCPDLTTLADRAIAAGLVASRPTAARLAAAERSLALAVEGVRLAPGAYDALTSAAARGWACHLASDLSTPFATVVDRLGLRPRLERIWLSCCRGVRKRTPGAWAAELGALGAPGADAVLVGDSWRGDVLPALAAGLDVVFVDHGAGHPARQLLTDVRFLLSTNRGGIELRPEVAEVVEALVPGVRAALRDSPESALVEAEDGTLRFAALAPVSVVANLTAVANYFGGHS